MTTTIQLATLLVKIAADSKDYQRQMTEAQKSSQKLADGMTNIGKTLTAGVTLPLIGLGTVGVKAASDLGESWSKANVVFGESKSTVDDFAKTSASAFGVSKRAAYEATGTFGNLFTTMGLGQGAAADMSVGLVKLASDQASFNNLNTSEVLEKIRSGLVGETEPLRSLGINLTAASVQAKAMEMGLASANGEVSQSALVQARYALILEQSANATGDFARTSDGLANSTRIAQAEFENAAAALGESLLPMATQGAKAAAQLAHSFATMPPELQSTVMAMGGVAAATGPVMLGVGKTITTVNTLNASLKAANISTKAFWTTLGVGVAVFAAVAAAAYAYYKVSKQIDDAAKATQESFSNSMNEMAKAGKSQADITERYIRDQKEANQVIQEASVLEKAAAFIARDQIKNYGGLSQALVTVGGSYEEYRQNMIRAAIANGDLNAEFVRTHDDLASGRQQIDATLESLGALSAETYNATIAVSTANAAIAAANVEVATSTVTTSNAAASWRDYQYAALDAVLASNAAVEAAGQAVIRQRDLEIQTTALAAGIDGPLMGAYTNYSSTLTELQTKYAEQQTELARLIELGYSPTGQKVTELTQQTNDTKAAIDQANASIETQTKSLLYNQMAANMDAEAALSLARHWGLLSETDYNTAIATEKLTDSFDKNKDGVVNAKEQTALYWKAVDDLNTALEDGVLTTDELTRMLNSMDGKVVTSYINVIETRYSGAAQAGALPGTGGYDDTPIPQASGGDWHVNKPTLFMAGEAGGERAIFIPDGKPAPSDIGGGNTYNIYGEFKAEAPQSVVDKLQLLEMLK